MFWRCKNDYEVIVLLSNNIIIIFRVFQLTVVMTHFILTQILILCIVINSES